MESATHERNERTEPDAMTGAQRLEILEALHELRAVRADPVSPLAEAILAYGFPVLAILPDRPATEDLEEAITLVVAAWNAAALSTPAWGATEQSVAQNEIMTSADSPRLLVRALAVLGERRGRLFPADTRVVESWKLQSAPSDESEDEAGSDAAFFQLTCKVRLPWDR